jgi:hypothetical protein
MLNPWVKIELPVKSKFIQQRIATILVGVVCLLMMTACVSKQIGNDTKAAVTSETSTEFPDIVGGSDGILEKILKDFYEDNKDAKWWSRIDKVVEGVIGDETAKMIYIKTDYRLDSVDDVEQGTFLCNALISHLPREGLSVRIDGLIRYGRTLLDGTVESQIKENPITDFGRSANTDGVPDWCVARTLFYSVVDGLKARGWKQQYGYGSLTAEEKKKMYEGAFMQEGPIYFK